MRHYRLMIPGPLEAEPELLAPLSQPLRAHYGPEWVSEYREVLKLLKALFRSERAEIYPIVGPGSAALDAAIGSVSGDGSPILVLSNGFFGERLRQIAASYTREVSLITAEPGRPLEPERLEEELAHRPELKTVAVVQGETSTGVLNPLEEIGKICRDHQALLLVDTVASLGGVPLEFDAWGIGLCVSSTQKCLGLAPGLAPLAVSPEAWQRIESGQSPGWYLNLRTWKRFATEWGDSHPHPVTMPTGLMRALQLSLTGIFAEGLESCWERHRRMSALIRRGLRDLGFELLAADECALPTVTAVRVDRRISASELLSRLKREHNLLIGGGLGELAGKIVRIGHMGPTASPEQILPTLYALEQVLRTAE
ncbi:MAG TPA: alanine--glyoxylate aminotransferase family protein [Candidatus Fraserbacteria bacterium]|nr:alanine--glyoxylate aminotransferase family protein [Candidatus Fraserbacteria bacterium]